MSILSKLLAERGIQAIEAGGSLAPAQSAYCAKICSKIITSQFCVALLNNTDVNGTEIPSANVHMEYGLMLGFNKYVIPFQRASQKLPFNVAGLDTIKYGNRDFERLASEAIDQAVEATTQKSVESPPIDQMLGTYLVARGALVSSLSDQGERNLFELGNPLGFALFNTFSGLEIIYFGNFTNLRPEAVLWRIIKLAEIVSQRFGSLQARVAAGLVSAAQAEFAKSIIAKMEVWVLVTSPEDKAAVEAASASANLPYALDTFSIEEVTATLAGRGIAAA